MFLPHRVLSLLAVAILLALCGCVSNPAAGSDRVTPGSTYLLHLPGIAGDTPFDRAWMNGLKEGGAADQVCLYDWTCRQPGLASLQAYDRNRREAGKVARVIAQRRREDPTGRIILCGESGGTGIALWALEKLPDDVTVDQVLLIAPAVSPGYDLSNALKHVKRKLHSFNSPGDWFILGVGTSVFGTMDGIQTGAAGLVGFQKPKTADPLQYRKLVDLRYDPAWMHYGDFGNHAGGMSVSFAKDFLAPMLIRDGNDANPQVVAYGRAGR